MMWKQLKKTLIHKWWVFIAGRKIGVGYWQLLIHDWQKFTPYELTRYSKKFFPKGEKPSAQDEIQFTYAWHHHVRHGPHHWEHWIMLNPSPKGAADENGCLPIPEKYLSEMLADWMGSERLYSGQWDMSYWLNRNFMKVKLHRNSQIQLVSWLYNLGYRYKAVIDNNIVTYSQWHLTNK